MLVPFIRIHIVHEITNGVVQHRSKNAQSSALYIAVTSNRCRLEIPVLGLAQNNGYGCQKSNDKIG